MRKNCKVGGYMLTLLLVISLSVSLPAKADESATASKPVAAAAGAVQEGFEKVASNGRLEMYLDESECNLAVRDLQNGHVWYASPLDRENDPVAVGVTNMEMGSNLIVQYVDPTNQQFTVSSLVGSVRRDSFKIENLVNGVRITYDFSREKERFIIPVTFTLNDDYLEAGVDFKGVREYGTVKITEISLLPYFGAGAVGTDGYMLLPDGCGTLVSFSSRYSDADSYDEPVYGRDTSLSVSKKIGQNESVRLPVFGLKNQDAGFLAVIDKGDAEASIECNPAGSLSNYGNVYSTFTYRQLDTVTLADKSWKSRDVTELNPTVNSQSPAVRYYFLSGTGADYSGMAGVFRGYIMAKYGLSKRNGQQMPLYLNLYGAVEKKSSVLGLIVNTIQPVTTFGQAKTILQELNRNGVPAVTAVLDGFGKGGVYGKLQTKLSFEGKLGGMSGYGDLLENVSKEDRVILGADFANLYKMSFGWWNFNSAAKSVDKEYEMQYDYRLSTGMKNSDISPWALLRYNKSASAVESYLSSFVKKPASGILADSYGDILYSDYNSSSYTDRQQAQSKVTALLHQIRAKTGLLVSSGNLYAAVCADSVINVPISDSSYNLSSRAVPFLQIALHGLINLAGPALNNSIQINKDFLTSVEYGMDLSFQMTGSDPSVLQKTRLDTLYDSYYADWVQDAAGYYKKMQDLAGLQNQFITQNEAVTDTLHVTTYEEGTRVVVNYGVSAADYQGHKVPALSYIILGQK